MVHCSRPVPDPVESRTGDDTAHRAVTAFQRCLSGSRSARPAGTPWANSPAAGPAGQRPTEPGTAVAPPVYPIDLTLSCWQYAAGPRRWRGPESDQPVISPRSTSLDRPGANSAQ